MKLSILNLVIWNNRYRLELLEYVVEWLSVCGCGCARLFIKIVMLPNCPYCSYFYFKAVKASWDMLLKEGRPNAKKVLVIISDKRSGSTDSEITNEVKPLQENDVMVIPVALGGEADERQLKLLTDDETTLVTAKTTDDTTDLKNKLMVVVFKGLLKFTL